MSERPINASPEYLQTLLKSGSVDLTEVVDLGKPDNGSYCFQPEVDSLQDNLSPVSDG